MQPHPPQLPTDAPASPAPKNLKKGAWLLLLIVCGVAALIAFLLPQKQGMLTKCLLPRRTLLPICKKLRLGLIKTLPTN